MALECIKENAELAERTIVELKTELETLTNLYNGLRIRQLQNENRKLTLTVEEAKKRLVQLEMKNGVKQVPLPHISNITLTAETKIEESPVNLLEEAKSKKEKKGKEPKEKTTKTPSLEPPVDVGRLDLRIAKIRDVQKHPDADSLYVLQIDCGEEKSRTVCSGLVKYIPIEDLKDRTVVLLCNLKPVKMRGITSEAMVMCASSPDVIEVLSPPFDCKPGDLVHCDGYTRNPDLIMNPKKKIFETVAPDLSTDDMLRACYKGAPLNVPGKGDIVASTLKNCPVK